MEKESADATPPPAEEQNTTLNIKRLIRFSLLFIFLSALGVYAVYSQVSSQTITWDTRLLSVSFIVKITILLILYFFMDGFRLWCILRTLDYRITVESMIRLVYINIFVSNVTPLATGGGVAQVWFLQRRGVPVGTGMTATAIRTILAVIFIFGAGPILLLQLTDVQSVMEHTLILRTLVIFAILYLSFFIIVMLRTKTLIRFLLWILIIIQRLHLIRPSRRYRWKKYIIREMMRFSSGFRTFLKGNWWFIIASFSSTAVFLLALFSFPACICTALGYDVNYWLVIARLVITTFVMYFSPTPGASGIAEGVFAYFFSNILSAGHLVLVTILWRALTIYLGMGVGLVFTHREITKKVSAVS